MKYYEAFERIIHRISGVSIYLAAASLFLMMILTTADVVGRYLFNSPVRGAQDMVEQGLVLCTFAGLGYVTLHRQHIRADMLTAFLSQRKNAVLGAVCLLISAPVAIIMAWQTCTEGLKVLISGKAGTPTIFLPIGPFFFFAGLGLVLMCIELVMDIIRFLREARNGEDFQVDDKGIQL